MTSRMETIKTILISGRRPSTSALPMDAETPRQKDIKALKRRLFTMMLAALALVTLVCRLPLQNMLAVGAVQSSLTAVSGEGAGHVVVSPVPGGAGAFDAEITVNIHGAAPDTTFSISRAPDLTPDGICTAAFIPFGESLTTSEGGSGATHFQFHRDPFPATRFDVVFRASGGDGSVLEGDCMTVTVK